MWRMVKKIGLWGTGIVLCATVVLSIFVIKVIIEFPRERFEVLTSTKKHYGQDSKVTFEEGSITKLREFSSFYRFTSEEKSLDQFIREKQASGEITIKKGEIEFNTDIVISDLADNTCDEIYCYQRKITFDELPSVFWKGLIGIEDYRFLDHFGVDLKSILRAIFVDIKAMKFVQGGSTLTQQLVKNITLTSDKKLIRKLKEAIYSIYIETIYDKETILQAYFNEIFWGAEQGVRIKGIYAASLFYFDKSPSDINEYEASILISLLKGPGYYSPRRQPDRLLARANLVFSKLKDLGFLSLESKSYSKKEWNRWNKKLLTNNVKRENLDIWLTMDEELSDLDSYDRFTFKRGVRKIGPFIKSRVGKEYKNISVKALVGNPSGEYYSYYSRNERNKEKAIMDERHLIGSTLKPILYGLYLDAGKKYDDLVSLKPISLSLKSGKWRPREAHKLEIDETTLIEALYHSYNIPVIRLADEYGWDELEKSLKEYIPNLRSPLKEYPAQLLGGTEQSLNEMYTIYKKFTASECSKDRSAGEDAINDKNLLFKLSDPNATTIRKVVQGPLKKLRFFGKTGTSNNGMDSWYIAFDGRLIYVIWVGYEGNRSGKKFQLYGAGTSYRIFQNFVTYRGKRFNELNCGINIESSP